MQRLAGDGVPLWNDRGIDLNELVCAGRADL